MANRRVRQILRNRRLEFERNVAENRKKSTKRGKKEPVEVEENKEAPKKKGKK